MPVTLTVQIKEIAFATANCQCDGLDGGLERHDQITSDVRQFVKRSSLQILWLVWGVDVGHYGHRARCPDGQMGEGNPNGRRRRATSSGSYSLRVAVHLHHPVLVRPLSPSAMNMLRCRRRQCEEWFWKEANRHWCKVTTNPHLLFSNVLTSRSYGLMTPSCNIEGT